jgi:hypothetical protein
MRLGHNHVVLADVAGAVPATDRRRWGRDQLGRLADDPGWKAPIRVGALAATTVLDHSG